MPRLLLVSTAIALASCLPGVEWLEGRPCDSEGRCSRGFSCLDGICATGEEPSTAGATVEVVGSPVARQLLTASTHGFKLANPPQPLRLEWSRCANSTCTAIASASGSQYLLADEDVDQKVQVTATLEGVAGAASQQTAVIAGLPPQLAAGATLDVTGSAVAGQVLMANLTTVTDFGAPAGAVQVRWQRCTQPTSCTDTGATGQTYQVDGADFDHSLRAAAFVENVCASGCGKTPERVSQLVGPVPGSPPVNVTPPMVSGMPKDGQQLTLSDGTWAAAPAPTFSRQWQRSPPGGGSPQNIGGATASTYVVTSADVGQVLRGEVTARNVCQSGCDAGTAFSAWTATVTGAPPMNTALSIMLNGSTATVVQTWTGTPPISYQYQWYRCGGDYHQKVIEDAPRSYWRLGEKPIPNPDFEGGITGWSGSVNYLSPGGATSAAAGVAHSGTGSLHCTVSPATQYAGCGQQLSAPLVLGQRYRIGYWQRAAIASHNEVQTCFATVGPTSASYTTFFPQLTGWNPGAIEWDANGAAPVIAFRNAWAAAMDLYLDDVQMMAFDERAVANHGTMVGTVATRGGALVGSPSLGSSFGNGMRYDVAPVNLFGSPRTYEAWVQTNNQGAQMPIFSNRSGTSGAPKHDYFAVNTGKVFLFGDRDKRPSGTSNVADGVWHHLAATVVPGAGGNVSLYVDGEPEASVTVTTDPEVNSAFEGHLGFDTPNNESWLGGLDEVAVYPTALSPIRVAIHYAAGRDACVPIKGSMGSSYTTDSDDVGMKLQVQVTATNVAGMVTATSARTP